MSRKIDWSKVPVHAETLEGMAELLEIASEIVEALKTGETAETEEDAHACMNEACEAVNRLVALRTQLYRRKPESDD